MLEKIAGVLGSWAIQLGDIVKVIAGVHYLYQENAAL